MIDSHKLEIVLTHLNATRSRAKTAEWMAGQKFGFSIEEAIAIAQAVCAVGCGQPSSGSLCAVINTL